MDDMRNALITILSASLIGVFWFCFVASQIEQHQRFLAENTVILIATPTPVPSPTPEVKRDWLKARYVYTPKR